MNAERLLNAIGGISDKHIVKYADVSLLKKKSSLHKKITGLVSIAATFVLIMSSTLIFHFSQPKDVIDPLDLVSINGRIYEIIPFERASSGLGVSYSDVLSAHGLTTTINSDSIGEQIGTFQCENGDNVTVYDYSKYDGQSVVIVQKDDSFYYGLFCNLDNNRSISIKELFNLYGITESASIQKIMVDKQIITDRKTISAFYNELLLSELDDVELHSDSSKTIKIEIEGSDSDVVIFDYYPADNVIYKSLSHYRLSTEFLSIIDEINQ
jgi:hypothetical protein